MKRRIFATVLCILIPALIYAQDTEPDDPGIVLPPVLLEIEDLQVEDVNAALPADEDQLRPEVSIPLPEAEDLYVPDYVFDIPYPDQVGGSSSDDTNATFTQYLEQARSPIFSDGQIGIGAPIYVLGDLSLYKLGDEPRFKLRFFHEKLDGYGFRQTGAGFYHSDDVLEGLLSYEGVSTGFEVTAGIQESSNGLQKGIDGYTADYESVSHRDVFGSATVSHQLLPSLLLTGFLDVTYGSQILAAETPLISSEIALAPEVQLALSLNRFDLGLNGTYEFISTSTAAAATTDHRIDAIISASYALPSDIRIALDAGVYWSALDALIPNITATAAGQVGTLINFSTTAGYTVRSQKYQRIWLDAPLLALAGSLSPEYGWTWRGTLQLRPVSTFLVTADFTFDWIDNVIDPSALPDTTTGLFSFTSRSLMALNTAIDIEWDITPIFGLDVGWRGAFIDRTAHQPVQVAGISFDAEDPAERFGFMFNTDVEFSPGVTIPIIGLGGYYRISDSVQFQLDVRDALSPLLTPGRYEWEPYIRPGLRAMLLTKISL